MAGSLQDQLLNMGVASKQQAKQAKQAKRKTAKKKKAGIAETDASDLKVSDQIQQAKEEKLARDRDLNRQRELQQQQKQTAAQAKQLVEGHAVALPKEGDVAYNFSHGKTIKKIYVDKQQQEMLAVGTLAVVLLDEKYHMLPAEIADRIASILPEMIISQHKRAAVDEDDPYKDFEVPDDLMW